MNVHIPVICIDGVKAIALFLLLIYGEASDYLLTLLAGIRKLDALAVILLKKTQLMAACVGFHQ